MLISLPDCGLFLSSLLEKSHDNEVSSWCTIYSLWNHVPEFVHVHVNIYYTNTLHVIGIACWRVAIISGAIHSPHSYSEVRQAIATELGHLWRTLLQVIITLSILHSASFPLIFPHHPHTTFTLLLQLVRHLMEVGTYCLKKTHGTTIWRKSLF